MGNGVGYAVPCKCRIWTAYLGGDRVLWRAVTKTSASAVVGQDISWSKPRLLVCLVAQTEASKPFSLLPISVLRHHVGITEEPFGYEPTFLR